MIYQVKVDSKWQDIQLGIDSLQAVADEINAFSTRLGKNASAIHRLLLQSHGATQNQSSVKTIFDIINVGYKVTSIDEDVLKLNYTFTIRYGTEKERERGDRLRLKHAEKERKTKSSWPAPDVVPLPKVIKGEVTIMPGN